MLGSGFGPPSPHCQEIDFTLMIHDTGNFYLVRPLICTRQFRSMCQDTGGKCLSNIFKNLDIFINILSGVRPPPPNPYWTWWSE